MNLQSLSPLRLPLAAAVAATLLTSAAHASVEFGKLVLSGYSDAAQGTRLMAGDYAAVITLLAPHTADFTANEVAASTNLCVAYVASHRLDEAHKACEEAIDLARLQVSGESPLGRLSQQDSLSVAYANRAVLNQLSGE